MLRPPLRRNSATRNGQAAVAPAVNEGPSDEDLGRAASICAAMSPDKRDDAVSHLLEQVYKRGVRDTMELREKICSVDEVRSSDCIFCFPLDCSPICRL